jgi:glycosyltransferase involved in cell wall biosynthesis
MSPAKACTVLNLIEATLHDQTGHSYTYAQCLIKANQNFNFALHLWLDQRAKNLLTSIGCVSHPYFYRPLRQAQKIFLYYKLLQQPGIILVGTTELWDLKILTFFAKRLAKRVKSKVFLHFHQFRQTTKKITSLQQLAKHNSNFVIVTPTDKLRDIFEQNGFSECITIACPSYQREPAISNGAAQFSKVLYAGAARADKGFAQVVDVIAYDRQLGKNTPFEIQVSAPSSQRYDNATQVALERLRALPPENLLLHANTLNKEQYLELFNNSICLLIYQQEEYENKFSAVALDAFYAGCPIVTAKNTWMGDMAERYGAGIALGPVQYTAAGIVEAIEAIEQDYAGFQARARVAARELAVLHDPRRTLEVLATC